MIGKHALWAGLLFVIGCQHAPQDAVPAVLLEDTETVRAALKAQLADALNKASVRFADVDLTASSTVTIVPPAPDPLETRSTALPLTLTLMTADGECFFLRSNSEVKIFLTDIACRPA